MTVLDRGRERQRPAAARGDGRRRRARGRGGRRGAPPWSWWWWSWSRAVVDVVVDVVVDAVVLVARGRAPRAASSPSPPQAAAARSRRSHGQRRAGGPSRQSRAPPSPTVTAAWRPSNGSGWPSRRRPAPRRARAAPVPGPVPPAAGRPADGGLHRHPLQRRLLRALPRPSRWPSGASGSSAGTPATAATRPSSSSSTRSSTSAPACAGFGSEAGVDIVVIIGNSGGGSLMGAYQSQATDPSIEATVGLALPDAVLDLLAADLYISVNAHPGRPEVLTAWMDPAVTDETDPLSVDPDLDMFDPAHGPPYAPEFVERYRAAQVARNDRITAWAHAELERLQAARAWDRVFNLHRVWADLRFADLTLDPSDRARRLLRRRSPRRQLRARSPSAARAPCGRGCRCGASRRRSAAARRTSRASRCRPSWSSRSPTAASSRATPRPSTTPWPPGTRPSSCVPGEHYFEDTGPSEVGRPHRRLDHPAPLIRPSRSRTRPPRPGRRGRGEARGRRRCRPSRTSRPSTG